MANKTNNKSIIFIVITITIIINNIWINHSHKYGSLLLAIYLKIFKDSGKCRWNLMKILNVLDQRFTGDMNINESAIEVLTSSLPFKSAKLKKNFIMWFEKFT